MLFSVICNLHIVINRLRQNIPLSGWVESSLTMWIYPYVSRCLNGNRTTAFTCIWHWPTRAAASGRQCQMTGAILCSVGALSYTIRNTFDSA